MKLCCKCNEEVTTGLVICGDCAKKVKQAPQTEEIEKAIEILENMWASSVGDYRYQNAKKIDTEYALDLAIQALKGGQIIALLPLRMSKL